MKYPFRRRTNTWERWMHIFLNVFLSYALNAVHSTNIYTYLWACQYERGSIWYFIKLSIVCTEMLQNRTAFDRIAKETSKTERAPAKLQREKNRIQANSMTKSTKRNQPFEQKLVCWDNQYVYAQYGYAGVWNETHFMSSVYVCVAHAFFIPCRRVCEFVCVFVCRNDPFFLHITTFDHKQFIECVFTHYTFWTEYVIDQWSLFPSDFPPALV